MNSGTIMDRFSIALILVFLAGITNSSRIAAQAVPVQTLMNLIFILADDLGWSDLGCYGADLHETPCLDRLASEGLRFTQAYSAGPVCTPTRASILTGRWPARLHMTIHRERARNPQRGMPLLPPVAEDCLPIAEVTLAEALKTAGYRTAHVGKWHLGTAEHYPETMGFDVNIGGTLWGAPATYWHPFSGLQGRGELRYVPHLGFGQHGEYLTDRLTDEAIRIMRDSRHEPFFLNLWYHAVHTPIEGKPEYRQYFDEKIRPGLRHQNAAYAAMIRSLDENIGRVLAEVDALGLRYRTIIVFFSDNGGFINPYQGMPVTDNFPLRSGKGTLYEGGLRVPLMIRNPGHTKAESLCDQPVSSTDLFPTLLELLGVAQDPDTLQVDGVSFTPLLAHPESPAPRSTFFWHYPHYHMNTSPVSAIRQAQWKLLEYFEDHHVELYNLAEDFREEHDLAARHPEQAQRLRQRLDQWRQEVGAQIPTPAQ